MLFSCLFCWLSKGSVYTVLNLDLMQVYCVYLVVCLLVSQPGEGVWAATARFSLATLLALLADHVCYVFVGFRLGCGCWVGVTMIASDLLNFRHCCALRLEGKSQVGIIPICVPSKGRIMPCCIIVARLPTYACASRHAPFVPRWVAIRIICAAALCLLIVILFIMG